MNTQDLSASTRGMLDCMLGMWGSRLGLLENRQEMWGCRQAKWGSRLGLLGSKQVTWGCRLGN